MDADMTNPTLQDLPLYTKKQTSKLLTISPRHLDNLMRAQAIEVIRIGKAVRFSADSIQRFKESRTVRAIAA